jgi:hypothetical protein
MKMFLKRNAGMAASASGLPGPITIDSEQLREVATGSVAVAVAGGCDCGCPTPLPQPPTIHGGVKLAQ